MKEFSYIDSPELDTVKVASKLTTLLISALYVFAYNIIFLFYTKNHTTLHFTAVLTAFSLIVLGIVFYQKLYSPFLALSGLVITALAIGFFGPNPDVKATASTALFLCCVLAVVTFPKKWIPPWIIVNVVILIVLVINIGIPTKFFGNEYPVRLFSVLQLLVVSVWFYRSWFPQLEKVRARDILNRRMAESRQSAMELQERTRAWRELAVHTHETVLNDIRSVLDSKSIDFKELRKQITNRRKLVKSPEIAEVNFSELISQVKEAISIQIDIEIQGARTQIPNNIYSALRAVTIEVCRNFERHSAASKITAKASLLDGVLRIELFHNGEDTLSDFESGIGQGIVIKETLDEINGKLFRRVNGVEISLALAMRNRTSRTLGATDIGRNSISAITVGNAVGGFLFPLALVFNESIPELVAGLCTLLLTFFAAYVSLKQAQLDRKFLLVAGLLAGIQVTSINIAIPSTASLDLLAVVTVLAGFALIAIIAWASDLRWWIVGVPWLVGIICFRLQIIPEESGTTMASLNTGYGLPFFAAIAIYAISRSTKRLKETNDLSELELRENAAAIAVADLAKELDIAILGATQTLQSIAQDEKLSIAKKNLLKRQDSLIRAIIQVDPKTSGGFSKAALDIVQHAVSKNVYVKVLTIRDHGLLANLPEKLLAEVKRIIENIKDSKTTIQVLANQNSSILVLKISDTSAERASLKNLAKFSNENLKVSVEKSDNERIIFIEYHSNN